MKEHVWGETVTLHATFAVGSSGVTAELIDPAGSLWTLSPVEVSPGRWEAEAILDQDNVGGMPGTWRVRFAAASPEDAYEEEFSVPYSPFFVPLEDQPPPPGQTWEQYIADQIALLTAADLPYDTATSDVVPDDVQEVIDGILLGIDQSVTPVDISGSPCQAYNAGGGHIELWKVLDAEGTKVGDQLTVTVTGHPAEVVRVVTVGVNPGGNLDIEASFPDGVPGWFPMPDGTAATVSTYTSLISGLIDAVADVADHETRVTTLEAENPENAAGISYDNATSGLAAVTTQAAIDEIDGTVDGVQPQLDDLRSRALVVPGPHVLGDYYGLAVTASADVLLPDGRTLASGESAWVTLADAVLLRDSLQIASYPPAFGPLTVSDMEGRSATLTGAEEANAANWPATSRDGVDLTYFDTALPGGHAIGDVTAGDNGERFQLVKIDKNNIGYAGHGAPMVWLNAGTFEVCDIQNRVSAAIEEAAFAGVAVPAVATTGPAGYRYFWIQTSGITPVIEWGPIAQGDLLCLGPAQYDDSGAPGANADPDGLLYIDRANMSQSGAHPFFTANQREIVAIALNAQGSGAGGLCLLLPQTTPGYYSRNSHTQSDHTGTGAISNQVFADTASDGTGTKPANIDHKHGMPAAPGPAPKTLSFDLYRIALDALGIANAGTGSGDADILNGSNTLANNTVWSPSISARRFQGEVHINTPADASWIEVPMWLPAGTADFTIVYTSSPDSGKVQLKLDGTDIGALTDMYSVGYTADAAYTASGITVATSGLHTLRATVNGKGSGSTYYLIIQGFVVQSHPA